MSDPGALGHARRVVVVVAVFWFIVAACAGGDEGVTLDDLEADPVAIATIPGTTNRRVTDRRSGADPGFTVLMDVPGDWVAVSAALARTALASGWTIESLNCVGSGNDVIGKKSISGTWVLLEAGAGTRGAGIILGLDPADSPPGPFSVSGRCDPGFVAAASGG